MIREMSVYCHKNDYKLRNSDYDFKDELKPSALLSLTQESACLSGDELGFGYYDLQPKNYGFIIVNTYCEIDRPVTLGKTLTVETWPLPPRHVIFERGYRVKCEGETVARLASRWCLVDLSDFSLLTPDKLGEVHTKCPYNPEKSVEVPCWKIPKLAERGEAVYSLTVKNSVCDHYFHANNTRYADFFFDCFTMDELRERELLSFQITYGKQAKEGARLGVYRGKEENGVTRLEAYCGEELLSQCAIKFGTRKIRG